jgi:hypothetical protein
MSDVNDKRVGVARQCVRWAGAIALSFTLYACSIVPSRMVTHWLDHWGMIPYTPVKNALNKFYAPVLWLDDHVPIV